MKTLTGLQKLLQLAAIATVFSTGGASLWLWIAEDDYYIQAGSFQVVLLIGVVIAVCFLVGSFFVNTITRRLLVRMLLLGCILIPFCLTLLIPLLLTYLLSVNLSVKLTLLALLLALSFIWSCYNIYIRKKLIIKTKYIEKFFIVSENEITYSKPKDSFLLDISKLDNETIIGRFLTKHASKILIVVFSAYPIAIYYYRSGNIAIVYLILFVISGLLLIYLIGKLSAGIYLYIYKVLTLEKLYKKPVLIAEHDDNLR